MKKKKVIYVLAMAAVCVAMMAVPRHEIGWQVVNDEPEDTLKIKDDMKNMSDSVLQELLDREEKMRDPNYWRKHDFEGIDTVNVPEDNPYKIHLIARAYEDHIALRWAPSEYVPFRFLRDAGYVVTRNWYSMERGPVNDTLAIVKPWSVDEFKAKFNRNDSVAGMAVELLYGKLTTLDQTEAAPGSMKGIIEVYEQQQDVVGSAMYIAETRPDLAVAMGLMYNDYGVKKGTDYVYAILPNLSDSTLVIEWGTSDIMSIGKYEASSLYVEMEDSVAAPTQAFIYWTRLPYAAYDIERREVTDGKTGEWKQLNDKPYISFVSQYMDENSPNLYVDNTEKPGTFEYRLYAYDSFGDRIGPSDPYRVEMPDMVPPVAPDIDQFLVTYITDDSIQATIFFHKDSLEADLVGYIPMYRGDLRDTTAQWQQLTDKVLPPGTTQYTVDVSGLSAGHVTIAAYDKMGNYSLSIEQLLNIDDYTPPSAPTNLRANVAPDGLLVLRWTAPPEPDVSYYEVYSANDPMEVFHNQASPSQRDTVYIDSLAQGLNQRYIYYKVKAIDFSGNSSEFSELLPVIRPNYIPPSVCRADSVWVTDDEINIWWIQSNEEDLDRHYLYRRLETDDVWTLLAVYNADSVRLIDDRIRFKDSPKPNMKHRYIYGIETRNFTGVTSGLSQTQTFLFTGPRIVDIKLQLSGNFEKKNRETRLAWETGKVPDYGPWYYCVYRKGPDDRDFQFMLATKSDEPLYNDFVTQPGETAEYYVMVQYDDGHRSKPSNIVSITAVKSDE